MTGYASAQHSASVEGGQEPQSSSRLGLEIRAVNSRFLDLSFRLPDELRALEPALRTLLTARLKRGKVEVRAAIDVTDNQSLPTPSAPQLQRLVSLQDSIQAWLPKARELSVADVLRLCNGTSASSTDWSEIVPPLAEQAVTDLLAARAREGERLSAMLLDRIQQLRELAKTATPLVPQLVEQQRLKFLERWKEAMALGEGSVAPEAAQDRALAEATAFAIRIDVAEEVTRLGSHLDEIERLLKKGGDIGKRLDFLIQELHREANTLGSKSATLELTRISVDMKVLIEQMREQVQNIE
ncbi:YicC/YloC family endoribonuclease [Comamonas resistens]|uniref:YicC/YloC family endoribonuclease n=1 Tax=Comamonas resistens TaxID=3046670 RepID=A0ABY8SPQ9_9BURK|nr:YicC/YloC family endoribonuclease [Comamonas resistens]MDL5037501.1 YicC/YloC family endoribonuclease [Comamonas resistens]WHS64456.1 YicC/YloC family endoribonuclease [Comamonas resistens]